MPQKYVGQLMGSMKKDACWSEVKYDLKKNVCKRMITAKKESKRKLLYIMHRDKKRIGKSKVKDRKG